MGTSDVSAWEPKNKSVANGTSTLSLLTDVLTESSGLAFSHVDPHCFWSHNDSGDKARLIGFNSSGRSCGRTMLRGIRANDWEDMASFVDEVPRLLVADVGDNDAQRSSVSIYLFDEPNPQKRTTIESFQHLVVKYADGAQNCEAVAVDTKNRRILLLGKSALVATMHQVTLPKRDANAKSNKRVTKIESLATPIQRVAIPLATSMDFCPKTGDLWISNYLQAFRYPRQRKTDLAARLKQVPKMYDLPKLKQIEAIAVDDKGHVWVTSEGKPATMRRLVISN